MSVQSRPELAYLPMPGLAFPSAISAAHLMGMASLPLFVSVCLQTTSVLSRK